QPVASQQLDDGDEGGTAPDALMAPAVNGQLGRLVQLLGQGLRPHLPHAPAEQAGPLESQEPVLGRGADLRQCGLDARPRVDRGEHHRQIIGKAEEAVGLQYLVTPESFGAPQQDAGGQAVALADTEQRVAQELAAGPVTLGEVRGELEGVLVHSAAPTACPSATAAKPMSSEPSRLAQAAPSWASWP